MPLLRHNRTAPASKAPTSTTSSGASAVALARGRASMAKAPVVTPLARTSSRQLPGDRYHAGRASGPAVSALQSLAVPRGPTNRHCAPAKLAVGVNTTLSLALTCRSNASVCPGPTIVPATGVDALADSVSAAGAASAHCAMRSRLWRAPCARLVWVHRK